MMRTPPIRSVAISASLVIFATGIAVWYASSTDLIPTATSPLAVKIQRTLLALTFCVVNSAFLLCMSDRRHLN